MPYPEGVNTLVNIQRANKNLRIASKQWKDLYEEEHRKNLKLQAKLDDCNERLRKLMFS